MRYVTAPAGESRVNEGALCRGEMCSSGKRGRGCLGAATHGVCDVAVASLKRVHDPYDAVVTGPPNSRVRRTGPPESNSTGEARGWSQTERVTGTVPRAERGKKPPLPQTRVGNIVWGP